VVLGGGGVVGIAWEAGVVAALSEAGVDLADADVVVGTSAGSVIGARVVLGCPADEIVDHALGRVELALDPDAQATPLVHGDPAAVREVFMRWMAIDEVDEQACAEVGMHAAASPTMSERAWVDLFRAQLPAEWPTADLRAVAVSVTSGVRKVFTADSDVPMHVAAAASCSVPGLFPPVTIDGDRYTDGGVWSCSNADLLLDDGLDAVVFAGAMVGDDGISRLGARSIERELAALRAAGTRTLAITPGTSFSGASLMDPTQREPALEAGRADAKAALDPLDALLRAPSGS
jgi:NTE family protein